MHAVLGSVRWHSPMPLASVRVPLPPVSITLPSMTTPVQPVGVSTLAAWNGGVAREALGVLQRTATALARMHGGWVGARVHSQRRMATRLTSPFCFRPIS